MHYFSGWINNTWYSSIQLSSSVALSRSFLCRITCPVSCPVPSSSALALLATTAAAAGHITACSLSRQSLKLFLLCQLETISLFHPRNFNDGDTLRQSGGNLSRQKEDNCAKSTLHPHRSTKQCKRHVASREATAKTLEAAR